FISSLKKVFFASITLTGSSLDIVSITYSISAPKIPLIKEAIKIRTGTWAKPPITVLISE
mgnify:CR=1